MASQSGAGDLVVHTPHTERARESQQSVHLQAQLTSLDAKKRYSLIKEQIETFREKVKLCENAYSQQLAESVISKIRTKDGGYIDCVYKLKQYLQNISVPEKDTQQAVYASWYISNLAYMKELKRNFDERIYVPLTELYHGHTEETNDPQISKENTTLSEPRSTSAASVLKFKNDLPEVKDLYDFAEVENVASRLEYLRQRWQLLLDDESEISPTLFSYNSQLEVSQGCPQQIFNLLRLVPDVLLKCKNAGSLARQWLESASSKAIDLETKYDKLERVKSVLTDKLTGLNQMIKLEEAELEAESTDLELLSDREERTDAMISKTQQINAQIQQLQSEIRQLNFHNDELRQDPTARSRLGSRKDMEKTIHNNELEVLRLNKKINLLNYEKQLLEEDLAVEMAVKPSLIRFTDHIQEKCESLEQAIDSKRLEKQQVESALLPVIADRNRTEEELSTRAVSIGNNH